MAGIVVLVLLALLCAYGLRWISGRARLPTAPTFTAVIVVFVLVVLALYGQSLKD